jgi:hypothetical protein
MWPPSPPGHGQMSAQYLWLTCSGWEATLLFLAATDAATGRPWQGSGRPHLQVTARCLHNIYDLPVAVEGWVFCF